MKSKAKVFKLISALLSVLFWILVWAALSFKIGSEFLLPSPADTLRTLSKLTLTADFWTIAGISLVRILAGILIAIAVGSAAAVLTSNIRLADSLLSPMMTVIKATPVASFIILALLWVDRNTLPIFITVLIVLPIVWSNVSSGIRSVDKGLLEVAAVYRFTFGKRVMKVYLPSIMPYFLAACRASLGMAWKAGIAAEVLCTPRHAIGTQIYFSKTYLETTELFSWTLAVILLSVIIEKLLILLLERSVAKLHVARTEVRNDKA